ncbi:MAG: HNH endonuclease domain-containing protein [Pseudomonadota bacterium]|nr:HNH endonuclease domain-containing protein [Pseudomonadota bacterium]
MRIDTGPLAGAFRDMTASYKAFWFLSLVDAVERRVLRTRTDFHVSFEEMGRGILDLAFWPAVTYRLSFGPSDQIHRRLESQRDDRGNQRRPRLGFDLKEERSSGILRHVPQRFLMPWVGDYPDVRATTEKDRPIIAAAAIEFETPGRIPYRILPTGIEIDRLWFEEIADSLLIMRALGERELIRFLQSRNPTVPGIPDKISAPGRSGLADQKKFWLEMSDEKPPLCFYRATRLEGSAFSLDHFVPWSFVAHDRIWNLVPMERSLNSKKGVRLPDLDLVDRMGQTHLGLVRKAKTFERKDVDKILGEYEADLRIDLQGLEDADFLSAHREAVAPLMALAKRSGFTGKWL